MQPRCRSSDNGSHRRWTHGFTADENVQSFGETLPSGASRQRNDMGDRVALLLLAAAAALAAEVRRASAFVRECAFSTILLLSAGTS